MRKVALIKDHPDYKRVILYSDNEGPVYLFPCTSINDGSSVGDQWYDSVESAEQQCKEEWGIEKEDWELVADPPPGCVHDWITPMKHKLDEHGEILTTVDKDGHRVVVLEHYENPTE